MVHSLQEAEIRGFTKEEINEFANHPISSSEYVLESKEIDPQVAKIIREHHENPEGTGFPHMLGGNQVSLLSAIFIIAHQLVKELYEHQFDPKFVSTLIKQIKPLYQTGNYKSVFPAFEKIFVEIEE